MMYGKLDSSDFDSWWQIHTQHLARNGFILTMMNIQSVDDGERSLVLQQTSKQLLLKKMLDDLYSVMSVRYPNQKSH